MNNEILNRLNLAMQEHEASAADIADMYVEENVCGSVGIARKYFGQIKAKFNFSIKDIVVFAKACNCTTDYLLGLSDRMN